MMDTVLYWLTPIIGYLVYFWIVPMLGASCKPKYVPEKELMPYWQAVWQLSLCFHIGAAIAGILVWLLYPYLFVE